MTTDAVIAIQNTPVHLLTHARTGQGRGGSVVLFNMHDDENTAVAAGKDVLRARGGRLAELHHAGTRNLSFRMDTTRFVSQSPAEFIVDPNRIFTDAGARLSLERLSHFDTAAVAAVRTFADEVLRQTGLDNARVIVTLHNNTEESYNARTYLPGAEYAADAAQVYLHPGADPDDFFFVTERPLFDALRRRGFNVVLQNNRTVTDDGSLSVLAARRGQRYVNVEAQHGHRREQARMIHALLNVLDGIR